MLEKAVANESEGLGFHELKNEELSDTLAGEARFQAMHFPSGGAYREARLSNPNFSLKLVVAEKEGFEPSVRLLVHTLSSYGPVS